jgi:hypothetical protein
MVVGGYSLDLYCDFPDESWDHRGNAQFAGYGRADFAAESGPEARAQAKRAGWKIDRGQMRAICPTCQKAGRVLPAIET